MSDVGRAWELFVRDASALGIPFAPLAATEIEAWDRELGAPAWLRSLMGTAWPARAITFPREPPVADWIFPSIDAVRSMLRDDVEGWPAQWAPLSTTTGHHVYFLDGGGSDDTAVRELHTDTDHDGEEWSSTVAYPDFALFLRATLGTLRLMRRASVEERVERGWLGRERRTLHLRDDARSAMTEHERSMGAHEPYLRVDTIIERLARENDYPPGLRAP